LAARLTGDATLADDAVQETLLQIRDHAGSFRPPEADPDSAARRWIMGVAANVSANLVRKRARTLRRELTADMQPAMEESPQGKFERDDEIATVRIALASLPQSKRTAIVLHHVAGLEFTEVARELNCPVGTAKTHVRRGLEMLRGKLSNSGVVMSVGTLTAVMQGLPAAATTKSATMAGLLMSPLKASPLASTQLGGIIMAGKIAAVTAAMAYAVSVSFMFPQDKLDGQDPRVGDPDDPAKQEWTMQINETQAVAHLKSGVYPAQIQFQAGAYDDADDDGIGEYGFFGKLSGQKPTMNGEIFRLLPNRTTPGYRYAIYLPGEDGKPLTEDALPEKKPASAEVIVQRERYFFCYAWPEDQNSGRLMFLVSSDGVIRSHPFEGNVPRWNEALAPGASFSDQPIWPPYVVPKEVRLMRDRKVASGAVSGYMCAAAYLCFSENNSPWPTADDMKSRFGGLASVVASDQDEKTCYVRPQSHPTFRQPVVVQNPKSSADLGCFVGFIDVSRTPSESEIDLKINGLNELYPTRVEYVTAAEAARIWAVAVRLALSDKARDQGITLEDWAEAQDIIDRISP
jgi:RNA polymerase sigma-70 factor (ECF subfamily)